ncbi:MAG: PhnD/SsuA/transferrin family substrate-binding protein [Gammaproteobacteria bacterium]|nr:PhnD/SsuA/transferrin family substrate-binding protein [Gammaproteobacteria bacterium]
MSRFLAVFSILLLGLSSTASALEFSLSIQPILPKKQIIEAYTPLANYLSRQTGHTITIKGHSNFITYWADMRRENGFDLVLDAAHFTDYRVNKKNYEVLAKLPDTVSFALVSHEDELVFDIEELVLKRVATLVAPSVGAIRLLDLFTDPFRQPMIVYARDSNDAAKMVMDKRVYAAIIPTALVGSYEGLNTITTTDSLPHMAFSASPKVPQEVRDKIRLALVEAKDTEAGQEMLSKINFTAFEKTDTAAYENYHLMLQHVLGY